jgi:hypothetical protein
MGRRLTRALKAPLFHGDGRLEWRDAVLAFSQKAQKMGTGGAAGSRAFQSGSVTNRFGVKSIRYRIDQ